MLQKISKDMKSMQLFAQWDEIASVMWKDRDIHNNRVYTYDINEIEYICDIENPVLMTDYFAIQNIQDYLIRETVYMLYTKPIRCIEYDDYKMLFEQRNYLWVWWPSIDTIFCSKVLSEYDFTHIHTVAEVWSWSWFIWRYIAYKNSSIQKIVLNDINPKAEDYYKDFPIASTDSEFYLGDATKFLGNQKFDMVVCNPPYIPRPNSIDDNPYEWLSLLQYLVENAHLYLNPNGKLMLNISSLTQPHFEVFVKDAWLKAVLLDSMKSPLKVFNILHNANWMQYLKEHCGLKEEMHEWHLWWHTILVYEISL